VVKVRGQEGRGEGGGREGSSLRRKWEGRRAEGEDLLWDENFGKPSYRK